MNFNLLIVALNLLAIALTVSHADHTAINICDNVADKVFLTDVANCSKYYICLNNTAIPQMCDGNLFFDASTQSCQANSSTCLTCAANQLSFHALAKTCNKYVMCFDGVLMVKKCYDTLQFNPTIGKCDLPQNVDCVENHCSIYNDPNNITYVPSVAACDKYYICLDGNPIEQTCAKSLQFNPTCNYCDVASNVKCSIKALPRSMRRSAKIPPSTTNISCPASGIHFYPHDNTASAYVMCSEGKSVVLSCADGLLFDRESSACRQPKNVRFSKV